MNIFSYSNKQPKDIAAELKVDLAYGLDSEEAAGRLKQYGPNEIAGYRAAWYHIFFRQFKSSFIYLLLGAALLAFILRERMDGIMIVLFVLINVLLGFFQEYRSEQTLKLLKQYTVSRAAVRRAGKEISVKSAELVPGDIVRLSPGDRIPADIRFIEAVNLKVNETVLSGESEAINKESRTVKRRIKDMYGAVNLGFSGTTVVSGRAVGIVLLTGNTTAMGDIAHLAKETRHVSGFEKGIARFSQFIIKLVVITLALVFLANILIKGERVDFVSLLIFSIALAVSVIPEALPLVMTFSLSRGALRLARKKVVVKRLSAIEDLGGIEVLATDKTGTLTENKLTVKDVYAADKKQALFCANMISAGIDSRQAQLEPFDVALWSALSAREQKAIREYIKVGEIPFDPARRRNGILAERGHELELVVRGAPEEIMALSRNLSNLEKNRIKRWISDQGEGGSRVLAVASRVITDYNPDDLVSLEDDLEFLGVISFADPIKPTTFAAIKKARELGVAIKIITGDSPEVAGAVAHKVGLIRDRRKVITGEEFMELGEEEKSLAVSEYAVFARILPEQKHKIIELLEREYEVGFLGEGINDTPALKAANVSIVVESAADAAREAADIVLLKKNLEVIIDGIRDGREVFANTTKYIKITLASNFGNFYAVAVASMLIDFLPMLPIQILLVNLLSDFPMIAIAADAVDPGEIASPKRYSVKDIMVIATILGLVSSVFDFLFFGLFVRFGATTLQTYWFIGSILTELALIYSLRTKFFFLKAKAPSGSLFVLSIVAAAATVIIPLTGIGREIFRFIRPDFYHLAFIFGLVAVYFAVTETVKLFYYRPVNNEGAGVRTSGF